MTIEHEPLGVVTAAFFKRLQTLEDTVCPCCNRYAKIYKRRVHAQMARDLIKFYKLYGASMDYQHVSDIGPLSHGDFAKLRYWRLIEEMRKDPDDDSKRPSGYWRITGRGAQFVRGERPIASYVLIWEGDKVGQDEERYVFIKDCLGDKFNYSELMGGV